MEILTIIAIVVGPIAAVLVTRWVDRQREQHQRRMDIFRTLMRTRRAPMSAEHVGALNLIEIEYAGDREVISCWKALFSHFGTQHARGDGEQIREGLSPEESGSRERRFGERLTGERLRLLAKLLHAMARRLGFKIEQLEIFEGGYGPQGWQDIETEQTVVRRFVVELALGRRTLPIGVFDYTRASSPLPASPAQDLEADKESPTS